MFAKEAAAPSLSSTETGSAYGVTPKALPWAGVRSVIHGSGPPRGAAQASKATLNVCALQMARTRHEQCQLSGDKAYP